MVKNFQIKQEELPMFFILKYLIIEFFTTYIFIINIYIYINNKNVLRPYLNQYIYIYYLILIEIRL